MAQATPWLRAAETPGLKLAANFIANRSISRVSFASVIVRATPWIARAERMTPEALAPVTDGVPTQLGYRPGGGGFIAMEAARRTAADGYTLLQLDSDDAMMWGDAGVAGFFIAQVQHLTTFVSHRIVVPG